MICPPHAKTPDRDIDLQGSRLQYFENYLVDHARLYQQLLEQLQWQQPTLTIYGRQRPLKRRVAFVGEPGLAYRYSGHSHYSEPWPACLQGLVRQLQADFGFDFNCALLNHYRDGGEAMGYHSDNEPELGDSPVIASVSLGAQRDFVFRRVGESRQHFSLALHSGSLLLMLPPCQRDWQHALPVRKRVTDGRINLTFRRIIRS